MEMGGKGWQYERGTSVTTSHAYGEHAHIENVRLAAMGHMQRTAFR